MKYMGSKRSMLSNGLGKRILEEASNATRFVDLFTGSAAVALYVAQNTHCEVLANDLQLFCCTLAGAVIERNAALESEAIFAAWSDRARDELISSTLYGACCAFDAENWEGSRRFAVNEARILAEADSNWTLAAAYAGHYFSPKQAYELEAFRRTLPIEPEARTVALAAVIIAASECAAAPGHTAQPFGATKTGAKYLFEAWRRDPIHRIREALRDLSTRFANRPGRAWVEEASNAAKAVEPNDLVFVDPPYSAVQYSRFYHVLETIARGSCGTVAGAGRYPPPEERPQSAFSSSTRAPKAIEELVKLLSERGATTILTFPRDRASNGLSGAEIEEMATQFYRVERQETNGRFSTLGGGPSSRGARVPAYELILTMRPR